MNIWRYIDRVEALSLREQLLMGATLVAFIMSLLQFFVIDPMLSERKALGQETKLMMANIERQNRQLTDSDISPLRTRKALLTSEIHDLRDELETYSERITSHTLTLVSARQMPSLLQALLAKESVQLVSLVNVPPISLLQKDEEPANDTGADDFQLYAHGIQLSLRGDFHTLRRYLIAVETQPWKLLWRAIRLETHQSGQSTIHLDIQTLSTDSTWLGV